MNNWKNIRLELGRTTRFPAGSVSRAYLIRLPLDDNDLVDRDEYNRSPHRATVRRYWSTEADEVGTVLRLDAGWAMQCDGHPARMLLLGDRPLRLGQEVSVVEADGAQLPFRVTSIR